MKQIPLLQGKALLIELPEGAKKPRTLKKAHGLSYEYESYSGGWRDLPPGNWRIIGMLSEVTEEQLDGLVECDGATYAGLGEEVFNYPNHCGGPSFETRLESLSTAIYAAEWYFENPYGKNPQARDEDAGSDKEELQICWNFAQSRVLCRERCLLLGREGL